jgi:hypothetical protein
LPLWVDRFHDPERRALIALLENKMDRLIESAPSPPFNFEGLRKGVVKPVLHTVGGPTLLSEVRTIGRESDFTTANAGRTGPVAVDGEA